MTSLMKGGNIFDILFIITILILFIVGGYFLYTKKKEINNYINYLLRNEKKDKLKKELKELNEECIDTSDCVESLRCIKGKCKKKSSLYGECNKDEDCIDDLTCFSNIGYCKMKEEKTIAEIKKLREDKQEVVKQQQQQEEEEQEEEEQEEEEEQQEQQQKEVKQQQVFKVDKSGVCSGTKWAIQHMTNSPKLVQNAADKGMNGIEVDVDPTTPNLKVHHGACDSLNNCIPSDCACDSQGICSNEYEADKVDSNLKAIFNKVIEVQNKIKLVYLDNKELNSNISQLKSGAKRIVDEINLAYSNGYIGQVLIGIPSWDSFLFLEECKRLIDTNKNDIKYNIFYTMDMDRGDSLQSVYDTVNKLRTLFKNDNYVNIVYSNGITICSSADYSEEMAWAKTLCTQNKISGISEWPLNKETSMNNYIEKGATGILTNIPVNLKNVMIRKNPSYKNSKLFSTNELTNDEKINGIVLKKEGEGFLCDGDDSICKSGHCDCDFPYSSGLTCKCTKPSYLKKEGEGFLCDGDDSICKSGHCDCDFPYSSGLTCKCTKP